MNMSKRFSIFYPAMSVFQWTKNPSQSNQILENENETHKKSDFGHKNQASAPIWSMPLLKTDIGCFFSFEIVTHNYGRVRYTS